MGLDADDHKAVQGSTRGLVEEFGHDRVFGTPLREGAMTAVAMASRWQERAPSMCIAFPTSGKPADTSISATNLT